MIIIQFVAAIGIFTVLGLLLAAPWTRNLPDRGLGFFPTVGLVAVTLPTFWIAHIPGLRAGPIMIWAIYILVLGAAVLFIRKNNFQFSELKIPKIYIFVHLFTWFILFAAYLVLRQHSPDIFGIEKLPDFSFLNSIYKYGSLPAENLFASDQTINYYYFGFFQVASIAWLGFLKANEAVNSMNAYVLATASTTLISLVAFFIKEFFPSIEEKAGRIPGIIGGWIAIIFAFLIGNAHAFFYYFVSPKAQFWYPDSTRYVANTIHEYPLYSYLIGDMHAHLLDIPNTVLAPLLIYLFSKKLVGVETDINEFLKKQWPFLLVLGVSFGLSYSTNSWNIFTNLMLIGFVTWFTIGKNSLLATKTLIATGTLSLAYMVGATLTFLPFWINFSPISNGVLMTPAEQSTPSMQLIIIWFVHLLIPTFWLFQQRNSETVARFTRIWLFVAMGFIMFIEFFYFKDIYSGHLRANTMFKIGLQVWLWLSTLTGIYAVVLYLNAKNLTEKAVIAAVVAFATFVGGTYTARAVPQYLESVKGLDGDLDGLDFIRKKNPDVYALLGWIEKNLTKREVILSAVADSFSEGGIVNAYSGHPTLVTWFNHVWLWNGTPDQQMRPLSKIARSQNVIDSLNQRRLDAQTVYASPSTYDTKQIIKKYGIKYILISPVERKVYPTIDETKLLLVGRVVFNQGNVKLYEVDGDL